MKENDRVSYIGSDNDVLSLKNGDVGTILKEHGNGFYEVEFTDEEGITVVLEVLADEFLKKIK